MGHANLEKRSEVIQGSLYYKPKQCTIEGEILQIYHTFLVFHSPPQMGNIHDPCYTSAKTTKIMEEECVATQVVSKSMELGGGKTSMAHKYVGVFYVFFKCISRIMIHDHL